MRHFAAVQSSDAVGGEADIPQSRAFEDRRRCRLRRADAGRYLIAAGASRVLACKGKFLPLGRYGTENDRKNREENREDETMVFARLGGLFFLVWVCAPAP